MHGGVKNALGSRLRARKFGGNGPALRDKDAVGKIEDLRQLG